MNQPQKVGKGLPMITMRTKFSLLFLVVVLLPIAIYTAASSYRVAFKLNELAATRITGLLSGIRRDVAGMTGRLREKVVSLAVRDDLRAFMARPGSDGHVDRRAVIDLSVTMLESTGFDIIEIVDRKGVVLARGHDRARFGHNKQENAVVGAILSGDISLWQGVESETIFMRQYQALKVAVPIMIGREVIGALIGGYLLSDKFVYGLQEISGAEIFLVTSGSLETMTLDADPGQVQGQLLAGLSGAAGGVFDVYLGGEDYYVGGGYLLENSDQTLLLAGLPKRDTNQVISDLRRLFYLVAAIGLVFSLIIGYLAAGRITGPLDQLVHGLSVMAAGDMEWQLEVQSNDEIGMLVESFNRLGGQLQEKEKKLIQMERFAAWRDVARRIAHEIKNPLFPIQLSIENLRNTYRQTPQDFDQVFEECTLTILEEVGALKKIVREFSEFARMPKPQLDYYDLNETVQHTMALYAAMPKGITLQCEYGSEALPFSCDYEYFKRAVFNIVGNAIDAMDPGGGVLTIKTRRTGGDPDFVVLEVIDQGCGIDEQVKNDLFTPYFTTKSSGTGLGLSIVKRIIDDLHGTIEVANNPARGVRVVLSLPVAAAPAGSCSPEDSA